MDNHVTTIHCNKIELIKKYIQNGKNVFICGPSGVGKTYIRKKVLENLNHVELLGEHLKSKSHFLPFIKPSTKHVFIEDYDYIFKSIIEQVSDGDRLTRGSLIVTSNSMCMYPNFETIFINKHSPQTMMTLTDNTESYVYNAAIRSNGNIRDFFTFIDGYDDKDTFKTAKEFISDILCNDEPNKIYDSISEHGHIWDVFFENYIDSSGTDIVATTNSFSLTDIFDSHIFSSGNWNLMPYFVINALTIPKYFLGENLIKEKIRPGSCWTKLGNYKMRKQKFDEIKKKSRLGLGIEELGLLKQYAEKGDLSNLIEYGITPQDFDVINHLAVGKGLKAREVSRIKKNLKNVYEGRRTRS